VELLLRLEKTDEAIQTARQWATGSEPSPEQLAAMAELLAKYGRRPAADELFARALAAKDRTPEQRFDLLYRRAVIHEGPERWRMLIEAAEVAPADSPGRRQCLDMILGDLNEPSQAEVAVQLAGRTQEPGFKAELMLRQADLTTNLDAKADLDWQVHQAGLLPEDRFYPACVLWNNANHPERVIAAVEQRLQSKEPQISEGELHELAAAYLMVGRSRDAQRATTSDVEPPAREQSPPAREPLPPGGIHGGGMF
jgi:hypothetical protein